jgi:hypothetical protein
MDNHSHSSGRRTFLRHTVALAAGAGLSSLSRSEEKVPAEKSKIKTGLVADPISL